MPLVVHVAVPNVAGQAVSRLAIARFRAHIVAVGVVPLKPRLTDGSARTAIQYHQALSGTSSTSTSRLPTDSMVVRVSSAATRLPGRFPASVYSASL